MFRPKAETADTLFWGDINVFAWLDYDGPHIQPGRGFAYKPTHLDGPLHLMKALLLHAKQNKNKELILNTACESFVLWSLTYPQWSTGSWWDCT